MTNPNKYIRAALVSALSAATGFQFYDNAVPSDIVPLPNQYGVVRNQSKSRTGVSKQGHEWLCSATIDLYSVNERGFVSSVSADDMEEQVITVMPSITVSGFDVKLVRFVDSVNFEPLNTGGTATISRNVVIYELWLNAA